MPGQPFSTSLDLRRTGRVFLALAAANLLLTATTALFIALWARIDELGETGRWLVRYGLVQGHLATENVVAAWYSSMLLLAVALLALVAWSADRRRRTSVLRHGWLFVAAAFLTLSVDEIGSLHERIGMIEGIMPGGDRPFGWVYVLLLPIAAVALFLVAFAWFHVRAARRAAVLMGTGVLAFLLNPLLERVEMAMIHGAGQTPGTWQRLLHDVLLVVEEGGLELFGTLLFLAAVATYIRRQSGNLIEWQVSRVSVSFAIWVGTAALAVGARAAPALTARLPQADTGMLQNWFPAALWFLVAAVIRGRQPVLTAAALMASAVFGTGLYLYVDRLASSAAWRVPVAGVCCAGLTLEAFAVLHYRFIRSPRSLTASPTLRRPRPNPS